MTLPIEYSSYFRTDAPKEGALTVQPGWFQLWRPNDIEQMNHEYKVSKFAPGFLGFGSSGGGELLAFDSVGRVAMIPMIGMSSKEARLVAGSWSEFITRIAQ
jgi:hypothetical protein